MPEVVSQQNSISDVILAEILESHGWTRRTGTLKLNAAATAAIQIGNVLEPVDTTKLQICATGANATCILLTHVPLADHQAADQTVVTLYRGPAQVKSDGVICATAQLAAATTALAALLIDIVATPTQYEEGL